jgi:acetyl-CoA carboxylase biotin carboxyl carrier protein
MSKDIEVVREFIKLAKEENVAELFYETEEYKIQLSMNGTAAAANVVAMPQQVVHATSAQTAVEVNSSENFHEIKSPFVGTFYLSPAPDKPNYVNVGDSVSSGQTLCILEAMKIMNEIETDTNGVIVEICVDNESLVEFGETLFKIRK